MAAAPMVAPTSCAPRYDGTRDQGNLPVTASPRVTAGLMWLPEMWPSAYTVATTIVPNASEIMPRSAMVNGALPFTMSVAGTAPTPMKTRNAVPMNSAASRWVRVFSSSMGPSLDSECLSTLSNVSRTLQLCFTADKVFRENLEAPAEIGRAKGTNMIQSVDRAIRVLTALQGSRRMTLTELATHLSLPASTTHGLVKTLVAHGMVVQERGSSRFQLGPAVLRLGNVYLDTIELRSKAVPWAEDLARRTGFAVRTGVLLLDDVVIIHHEQRPDGSRQMPEVGIVIPSHASALGKAMLAFVDDAAAQLFSTAPLRSMTGETITSPDDLKRQLTEIATAGLADEQDEALLGECALAGPVFEASGAAV